MLVFCSPLVAQVAMYLSLALIAIAAILHILTHFNRLPGTVDFWDFVPFVSYGRILFKSTDILTKKGYLYWKLYQLFYALVILIMLLLLYAYLPACLAAAKAS